MKNMVNTMERISLSTFGKSLMDCNNKEKYIVVSKAVMEDIIPKWINSEKKFEGKKRAYYFSAEYLMGRSLTNNLINMKCKSEVESILEDLGIDYNCIEKQEEDAGLGNGGLGR